MNTVVVPEVVHGREQLHGHEVGHDRPEPDDDYFFRVPAGTPAFKVDFAGPSATPGTGQARFLRFHPYGVGIDSNASNNCYSPAVAGGPACNPNSRTTTNPHAGVWEVTVEGAAHVGRGDIAVHADGVDPRRDRLAEPGHHRVRDDRRADRTLATR